MYPTVLVGQRVVVTCLLEEVATAERIACTLDALDGATYTDADVVHMSRNGIPTGLISVPISSMHTLVAVAQLSDAVDAACLLAAFVDHKRWTRRGAGVAV